MNPIHPALAPLAVAAKALSTKRDAAAGSTLVDALRGALARSGEWLRPEHRIGDPTAYMRHVLYADADGDFVMTAITWLPGQRSPVHAHQVWCAFGVAEGELTEERFALPVGNAAPAPAGTSTLPQGAVAGLDLDGRMAHRVSNHGMRTLVSLHLYGVPGEKLTTGINRVFA